jgi:iron complex outermembrane receptor protein
LPGTADTSRIFNLGEVRVLGHCSLDSVNTATSRQFEAFNRLDVGRALNLLPGVNLSAVGARNESMVYVRGFDLRQVPGAGIYRWDSGLRTQLRTGRGLPRTRPKFLH